KLEALGVEVPTLADMEEIEISNRLYREDGVDVMTVVLPGKTADAQHISGPVSFILSAQRLVTVRHHAPRPFDTFAARATRSVAGIGGTGSVFLGLIEEIVARQADLLEGIGRSLDEVSASVLGVTGQGQAALQSALAEVGRQGEMISRVRLALLTLERAMSFYVNTLASNAEGQRLRAIVEGLLRDIQSLSVQSDFLSSRLGLSVDATLGMINLAQNATIRVVSVVTALFLPPTMIASTYGMNFRVMPELDWTWGYPMALGMMAGSVLLTYLLLKWRDWL
uniref:CorA family divalent cation transporter n=1 Tax=Phaeovulum sp. TaxID=2934796 RepID=UPI0039E5D6D2